jgi:hypothetical protein
MPGAAMLERVRPWCDLGAVRSTKSEETRIAKALQTSDFWTDVLTRSLAAIQHRQHEIAICRSLQAL